MAGNGQAAGTVDAGVSWSRSWTIQAISDLLATP